MDYVATGITFGVLWLPFFNIGLGLDPWKLSLVLVILRAVDAFYDPIIGNISDNARTRWGRRRPFLFVGAIGTGLLFPIFWFPPAGWGETGVLAFLTVFGLLYFAVFTIWAMPYYGMQLELTPNYDERTRLTAWMTIAGKFAGLAGGWVMAVLSSSWFTDPSTGKPDIVHGMRVSSWFIAGIIIVLGLMPALFVKERYYTKDTSHQPHEPLWQSVKESFGCRPLWNLIAISFFVVLSSTSVGTLGQYINIYYINNGGLAEASIIEGWKSTAMLVAGIASVPVWTWLSEHYDKKTIVGIIILGGMFGHLTNWFCLDPKHPYLQLIPAVFQSAIIASIWLFLPSMKADVADYDELHTGKRREGALNAFYSWFIKASLTASMGVGGLVLVVAGFDVKLPAQSPEVLNRMMLYYLAIPVIILVVALVFVALYSLNRERMSGIRAELESRRGAL